MDPQRTKSLQARTEAKLRYAKVHLDELAQLQIISGQDFDRAHSESFLFHLFGAKDALLAELNYYYGADLPAKSLTPGQLRTALTQRGVQSPELGRLSQLDQEDDSWYSQAKGMRDHGTHHQGVPRVFSIGGPKHGQVRLKNPETGTLAEHHVVQQLQYWLKEMTALVRELR
jgi:hypothetical protein